MIQSYNPYGYTWWLRTPGENASEVMCAGYDYVHNIEVYYNDHGVRPAMYIKIK